MQGLKPTCHSTNRGHASNMPPPCTIKNSLSQCSDTCTSLCLGCCCCCDETGRCISGLLELFELVFGSCWMCSMTGGCIGCAWPAPPVTGWVGWLPCLPHNQTSLFTALCLSTMSLTLTPCGTPHQSTQACAGSWSHHAVCCPLAHTHTQGMKVE